MFTICSVLLTVGAIQRFGKALEKWKVSAIIWYGLEICALAILFKYYC